MKCDKCGQEIKTICWEPMEIFPEWKRCHEPTIVVQGKKGNAYYQIYRYGQGWNARVFKIDDKHRETDSHDEFHLSLEAAQSWCEKFD